MRSGNAPHRSCPSRLAAVLKQTVPQDILWHCMPEDHGWPGDVLGFGFTKLFGAFIAAIGHRFVH